MKNKIDLSVVVTVHDEGLLAHKTMLSVFEGIDKAEKKGYHCEIIVHIDNGDRETKDYFKRYDGDKKIRVLHNCFNDLGLSRNSAIAASSGEYISFLNGDDLLSDNWYVKALEILDKSKQDLILHPEAVLAFRDDAQIFLTLQKPSMTKDADTLLLLGENRWESVMIGKRDIFLKTPYVGATPGYVCGDYVFNIETIEQGIKHEIVDETVLFKRRKNDKIDDENHTIIPYASLFGIDSLKKVKDTIKPNDFEEEKAIRRANLYKRIRSNRIVNAIVTPLAIVVRKTIGKKPKVAKIVPDFVLEEWIKINKIDSQLYPHQQLINGIIVRSTSSQNRVGSTYYEMMKGIEKKPDYVFIAPFVTRGGAEKVLINYVRALSLAHPKWHFAIITTLPSENNWTSKLPDCVDIVDFGNFAEELSWGERETLFSRILIQLNCPNLHIINSEYGYRWLMCHKDLAKNHFNITASLFASGFVPGSNMRATFSYDNPFLLNLYDVIKKIFTDNKSVIEETVARNGYSDSKFVVHYQPVEEVTIPRKEKFDDGKIHILWAGRIANVKLPKVVAAIGKGLHGKKFVIDVYGEMSDEVNKHIFDMVPTIRYHGAFESFDDLMGKKYDVFLYTSLSDGIPNTILEAASYGVPIVASNDGGVGEVVQDGKTGILIDDIQNAKEYIEAIKKLSSDEDEREKLVNNARKLVEKRHSWASFMEAVKKDFTENN